MTMKSKTIKPSQNVHCYCFFPLFERFSIELSLAFAAENHHQLEGIIMEASQTIHEFFITHFLLPKLARLELALSPYGVEQTSVNYNLHYIFYFILAVS